MGGLRRSRCADEGYDARRNPRRTCCSASNVVRWIWPAAYYMRNCVCSSCAVRPGGGDCRQRDVKLRVSLDPTGNTSPMFQRTSTLAKSDPELWEAITAENRRQEEHIELIASENYVSTSVLQAQGSQLTNKYAEGYPGKRYYGGCAIYYI